MSKRIQRRLYICCIKQGRMNQLKSLILPRIAEISITLGAVGLVSNVLRAFTGWQMLAYLEVASFNVPIFGMLNGMTFGEGRASALSMMFMFMLLLGGLIYRRTDGQDSRVLRFTYSLIFVKKALMLISMPVGSLLTQRWLAQGVLSGGSDSMLERYVLPLLIGIPLGVLAFLITRWLIADQVTRLPAANLEQVQPAKVSRWTRFWHLAFDSFLIMFVTVPVVLMAYQYWFEETFTYGIRHLLDQLGRASFAFVFVPASIFYYLLFEGFFGASPAKFISGTRVVGEKSLQTPGFGKILGRTFSRRIPLEALSFFGERGWHDSISGTVVVSEAPAGQGRSYHKWWGIALVGLYVLAPIYSWTDGYFREKRNEAFGKHIQEQKLWSGLSNLQAGDILHTAENYKQDKPELWRVIEPGEEAIRMEQFVPLNSRIIGMGANLEQDLLEKDWLLIDTLTVLRTAFAPSSRGWWHLELPVNDQFVYQINAVYSPLFPTFISAGGSSRGSGANMDVVRRFSVDKGPFQIESIEVVEGQVNWTSRFPVEVTFSAGTGHVSLEYQGEPGRSRSRMWLRMDGQRYEYVVEGLGDWMEVYRAY